MKNKAGNRQGSVQRSGWISQNWPGCRQAGSRPQEAPIASEDLFLFATAKTASSKADRCLIDSRHETNLGASTLGRDFTREVDRLPW